MQDMTTKICENTKITEDKLHPITKQLIDNRDNKKYWVSKLADGNCWMVQNLDLDLNATTLPLTPASSDVTENWSPEHETIIDNNFNPENGSDPNSTYSWDVGDYVLKDPMDFTACSTINSGGSMTECSRLTLYDDTQDAHYKLGNFYSWNAAVAGTGKDLGSANAMGSVCPKGWMLPSNKGDRAYVALMYAYSVDQNVAAIVAPSLYMVRAGRLRADINGLVDLGNWGCLRSSWAFGQNSGVDMFRFTNNSIDINTNTDRSPGFSVRCVAR